MPTPYSKNNKHQKKTKMASPTLDLLCCVFYDGDHNSSHSKPATRIGHPTKTQMLVLGYVFFASLFLSSLASIIGTVVTLMPKKGNTRTRREAVSDDRQRIILSWLAAADMSACIGILVFAFYCMLEMQEYVSGSETDEDSDTEMAFCVFFTAWVQFFYLATYFWTLFYALDVYLMLRGIKSKYLFILYFLLTWLLSAVLIIASLLSFYEPHHEGPSCSTKVKKGSRNFGFIWGSYLALMMTYIAMPILYYFSSRLIKPMLQRTGVYTNRERKVKAQIQKKFMRIVIVFIVCWAPNVINGILQLYLATSSSDTQWWQIKFMIPVWLLMSLLNPMQAFLNALVYWGPAGCTKIQSNDGDDSFYRDTDDDIFPGKMTGQASLNTAFSNGEQTPLLRSMKM